MVKRISASRVFQSVDQRHSGAPPLAVQQGFVVVQIYADSRGGGGEGKPPRASACTTRVLSSAACVKRCKMHICN